MSSARKIGRTSKLTPEVHDKIVTAIRAGNYANVSAQYAGITERTFYRWMERGEAATSGKYRRFWLAIKEAECEAEVRAVATIQKQMPDNWRAALSYLERKHPRRWGRRVDVTSGDERLPQATGILVIPQREQTAEEDRVPEGDG